MRLWKWPWSLILKQAKSIIKHKRRKKSRKLKTVLKEESNSVHGDKRSTETSEVLNGNEKCIELPEQACDVSVNGGEKCVEVTEQTRVWAPVWDDYYKRYYFYNTETLDTTWVPPSGLEHFSEMQFEDIPTSQVLDGIQGVVETDGVEDINEENVENGHLEPTQEEVETEVTVEVSKSRKKVRIRETHRKAGVTRAVYKYWLQRYSLFSKFDNGIRMDEEGWFSVTPEVIAKHQAIRCQTSVLIDAFTGVGGNAIQFALRSNYVIAIDKDPSRIACAKHNAEIYGVADKIEFIIGDFFELAPHLKAEVIFLSPPWGGPEYMQESVYDMNMLQPKDGFTLFKIAQEIAPNIVMYLPRNVDCEQVAQLAWLSSPPLQFEVEKNFVNDRLKAVTVYYGEFAFA